MGKGGRGVFFVQSLSDWGRLLAHRRLAEIGFFTLLSTASPVKLGQNGS